MEENGENGLAPLQWTTMPTQHESNFPLDQFRVHIQQLLRYSGLDKKYIRFLTNDTNINIYIQSVTHAYFDPIQNYEWYEMMGDAILNKCMVYYINQRFPFLHNHQGVKVIARLKINLVSKKTFAEISCRLGFPPFIRFIARETMIKINPKSLFEDVLESFFGVTEWLMDKHYEMGSGHVVCFRILKRIMDAQPISLKYEDLFDNITRLKELFDMHKMRLPGQVRYENNREDNIQIVSIYQYCPQSHRKVLLHRCSGIGLDETKQKGAGFVIEMLRQRGFHRPSPIYYQQLERYMENMERNIDTTSSISSSHPCGFLVDKEDILSETGLPAEYNRRETNVHTGKEE